MAQKAAIYGRVSTPNQKLLPQLKKLCDRADQEDWNCDIQQHKEIPAEISGDEDITNYFAGQDLYWEKASSVNDRPELEKIMDNLQNYDLLVVSKIDRFARSITDFDKRMSLLSEHDVEFKAVDQPVDTQDEMYGDFFRKLLALFAELERKMIRRRMEEGFEKAKEEGRVGRPSKMNKQQREYAARKYDEQSSVNVVQALVNQKYDFDDGPVSRSAVYRALKKEDAIGENND